MIQVVVNHDLACTSFYRGGAMVVADPPYKIINFDFSAITLIAR